MRRSPFSLSVPSLPSSLFSPSVSYGFPFLRKRRDALSYTTLSLFLPNTGIGKVERPLLVGKLLFASGLLFLYYSMIPGKSRFLLLLFLSYIDIATLFYYVRSLLEWTLVTILNWELSLRRLVSGAQEEAKGCRFDPTITLFISHFHTIRQSTGYTNLKK
jgi:hypothetical protein